MNILVTGGLGLIGHNVVKRLQDQGHVVSIIDNQTNYGIIPQDEIEYLVAERTKKISLEGYYNADICDIEKVNHIFNIEQPEVVIHLASFPRQKVVNSNPGWGSRVMSEGLLNLLEASKNYDVRKFVYVSSSMVYGDFSNNATEHYICKPMGQYGILKFAGEWLLKDYTDRENLTHTILRPSAVYGPLDVEDRVVAKFMLTAMRGGVLNVNGAKEELDFTYVDDVADGVAQAAVSDNTDNKTYNLTRSRSRTLLEAAELAIKIVGKGSINVQDKDVNFPSRGSLNINKATRDFKFEPKIDIEEGFQKYYEWLSTSTYWRSKL